MNNKTKIFCVLTEVTVWRPLSHNVKSQNFPTKMVGGVDAHPRKFQFQFHMIRRQIYLQKRHQELIGVVDFDVGESAFKISGILYGRLLDFQRIERRQSELRNSIQESRLDHFHILLDALSDVFIVGSAFVYPRSWFVNKRSNKKIV